MIGGRVAGVVLDKGVGALLDQNTDDVDSAPCCSVVERCIALVVVQLERRAKTQQGLRDMTRWVKMSACAALEQFITKFRTMTASSLPA